MSGKVSDEQVLVTSSEQIRQNIAAFNALSREQLPPRLLRQTSHWVFDPESGGFGPGKFVGFQGMTAELYNAARNDPNCESVFDGGRTRAALVAVVGSEFAPDTTLGTQLVEWSSRRYGETFEGIAESKWTFLALR